MLPKNLKPRVLDSDFFLSAISCFPMKYFTLFNFKEFLMGFLFQFFYLHLKYTHLLLIPHESSLPLSGSAFAVWYLCYFQTPLQQANSVEPTIPHHSSPLASSSLLQQTWAHQVSLLHVFAPVQEHRIWLICPKPPQWFCNIYSYLKSHWKSRGRVIIWYLCTNFFPVLGKESMKHMQKVFFHLYFAPGPLV